MEMIGIRNLCTPAYVYLVVSIIAMIIMLFQNIGNVNIYCLGSYSCSVGNTTLIFIIKMIYVLFWTWILNLICRSGATGVAWFLVLLPFILMFVLLALLMLNS
jgi:hypothetical protein